MGTMEAAAYHKHHQLLWNKKKKKKKKKIHEEKKKTENRFTVCQFEFVKDPQVCSRDLNHWLHHNILWDIAM
jgi:hypothetical protein